MNFKDILQIKPKKFTEECALVSVYFNMGKIKGDWYLNYISAPGGAWQELKILKKNLEKRFYIGKNERRPDLVMQHRSSGSIIYAAEAKEFFRLVMQEREKIDDSLISIYNRIKSLNPSALTPIFSYIIGIDSSGLNEELLHDAICAEENYIRVSINKLPEIQGGRVCLLVYWKNGETKFLLIFSNDVPISVQSMFQAIFI